MTIEELRIRIDELDRKLVELLSERARAAQMIGHLKAATSLPVYEPDREKIIYANVRAANQGPLPDIELTHIYERIIDVMRALQRNELASQRNAQAASLKSAPGHAAGHRHARDRKRKMIVAMQEKATEEQIDAVISAMEEAGVDVHRTTGEFQTILAGCRTHGQPRHHQVRNAARRAQRSPHQFSLQTRRPRLPARRYGRRIPQRRKNRRSAGGHHRRAVRHRKPRADFAIAASASRLPAEDSCAAARSSRAARPTRFRAWAFPALS